MQTVERHGGGSHFVRPDRVYRTGVLTSTMGYDPGADVQSVASAFTQYPMDLQVPYNNGGLEGLGRFLGATSNIGLIPQWRARFAAWRAKKQAQAQARHGIGPGVSGQFDSPSHPVHTAQFMPGGAYGQVGEQYSPQMIQQNQMVAHLMQGQGGLPHPYAEAQASTSWRNWTSPWWNARY